MDAWGNLWKWTQCRIWTQRRTWKKHIRFEKTTTLYIWRKQSLQSFQVFEKEGIFCPGLIQPFCGLTSIVAGVKVFSITFGGLIKTGNPHLCVMNRHAILNFPDMALFQGGCKLGKPGSAGTCLWFKSPVHPHTANIKPCIWLSASNLGYLCPVHFYKISRLSAYDILYILYPLHVHPHTASMCVKNCKDTFRIRTSFLALPHRFQQKLHTSTPQFIQFMAILRYLEIFRGGNIYYIWAAGAIWYKTQLKGCSYLVLPVPSRFRGSDLVLQCCTWF